MNIIAPEVKISHAESPPLPRRKVCMVTGALEDSFFDGGIGTANRALALTLGDLNHDVDILYTRDGSEKPFRTRAEFAARVEAFGKLGINLKCIRPSGKSDDCQEISYLVLQHLLQNRYDAVFFGDPRSAYYPLLAKKTGSSTLRDTKICINARGGTKRGKADCYRSYLSTLEVFCAAEMERRSIELADCINTLTAYVLEKYRNLGWAIPKNSLVLPDLTLAKYRAPKSHRPSRINEIVFLGDLENEKSLWMVCRAIERIKSNLADHQVTFLGRATQETRERILRVAAAWPFPVRLLTDFDHAQVIGYLKGSGRLAVIPSLEDYIVGQVLICLGQQIPFVASMVGGVEELLDEHSRQANLFEPTVEHLYAKLVTVIEHGATLARPSFDPIKIQTAFRQWSDCLLRPNLGRSDLPANAKHDFPVPILMVIVSSGRSATQSLAELRRTIDAFHGNVHIEAFVTETKELRSGVKATDAKNINVNDVDQFDAIARSLALGPPTVVGLCHVTQLPTPVWIERARACFAMDGSIAALTGMAAVPKERQLVRAASHAKHDNDEEVERYLMGYAPPLFGLTQQTNSGFTLIRSEMLGTRCSGPLDEQYDRFKRMQDWIHEILVQVHTAGNRFELVPDLLMQPVEEPDFEAFRLEQVMHGLPSKLYGYEKGSEQSILARLAIDTGLLHERSLAHAKYIRNMASRIGADIEPLSLHSPWETQARQLAKIAYAGGQIELANDFCPEFAIEAETARQTASEIVDIEKLVASVESAVIRFGRHCEQKKQTSLILSARDNTKLEMQVVGPEPSGFVVPSVKLANITHFTSLIEVREPTETRVRFWLELVARGKKACLADKIVRGGEKILWEFECPRALRVDCTVRLGVELADIIDSTETATIRWINPQFVRRP